MTKNFKIKNSISNPHTPRTFEVEITVMHGDADSYDTFVVKPFLPSEVDGALTSLIETLDRVNAAYPNGRGGDWKRYGYNNIEGYESWFGDGYGHTEEEYKHNYRSTVPYAVFAEHYAFAEGKASDVYWPWDVTGADIEASLDGYQVFYYDDHQFKHAVDVSDATL